MAQSPDSVPFEPGLSPLLLGPSTAPGLRLQPSSQGGFLFAEQAEGPGEPAYSTKVSLSSFYSGGLNKGFGWPGRGGSSRLPTEPPFSPGIKYLLSPS